MLIQIQPPQVSTLTLLSPAHASVSAPCQSSFSGMCVFSPSRLKLQPWKPQTNWLLLPLAFFAPGGVSTRRRPRCVQTLW